MRQRHHPRRAVIGLFGAGLLFGACQPVATNGNETRPSPPGAPSSGRGDRAVSSDDEHPPQPVSPDEPRGISGTLRDRAGRPVAGVFVQAMALGDSPALPDIAIFSDARGRYHWPLPPGRYRLSAEHDGRRARADVTVPGAGHARQDLILS